MALVLPPTGTPRSTTRVPRALRAVRETWEHSPSCVVVVDGSGRVEWVNAAAQIQFDVTAGLGVRDLALAGLLPATSERVLDESLGHGLDGAHVRRGHQVFAVRETGVPGVWRSGSRVLIWERVPDGEAVQEAETDLAAVTEVMTALAGARGVRDAAQCAVDAVRRAFGWAYASYWSVGEDQVLRFVLESNEVKELARETAVATTEITAKIDAIQQGTSAAVKAIAEIGGIIHTIDRSQSTIAAAVEQQTATTKHIADNVGAAAAADGITQDVAAVASASADTTEMSHQILAAAQELSGMARELMELLD